MSGRSARTLLNFSLELWQDLVLLDTFIIYSSISHQRIFRKDVAKRKHLENRKSENPKNPGSLTGARV